MAYVVASALWVLLGFGAAVSLRSRLSPHPGLTCTEAQKLIDHQRSDESEAT